MFTLNATTVEVPVRVEVLPETQADAGTLYLSLIDGYSGQTVQQLVLTPENGRYQFSFSEVFQGSYYLMAGSDLDNDFSLSDYGESVGGYPSMADWHDD